MLQFVLTECRKFTKIELFTILSYKVVPSKYGRMAQFDLIDGTTKYIPLHPDFEPTQIENLYILTYHSYHGDSIKRIASKDITAISNPKDIKQPEPGKHGIFTGVVLY